MIAQAHRSVYKNDSSPIITDLIDNIMSIPSCLQDAKSKVTLVREWIKQNPRPPSSNTKLEPEVQKIEPPIKEPYNGGTGEAAKKAALQAQQVGAVFQGPFLEMVNFVQMDRTRIYLPLLASH